MAIVSLADAKARLSELVHRAERGEPVQITRRGKPVVQMAGLDALRKPLDVGALRRLTRPLPAEPAASGDGIRRIRDAERY